MEWVFASALAGEAAEPAQAAENGTFLNAVGDFFQSAFKKFGDFGLTTWIMLGALVALGLILLAAARSGKKWNAKVLAYAALSIALSFVLSYIRLFRMPQGGSITPGSMLPLMLFAAAFGVGPGVVAGLAYGLLQYLQGGDFLNVWQFLLDYPIAFAALGLAGVYKYMNKKWVTYASLAVCAGALVFLCVSYPGMWGLYAAMLAVVAGIGVWFAFQRGQEKSLLPAMGVAVLGRAASAVFAGLMWALAYPVEGQLPLLYSVTYNLAYLLPELVICMALGSAVGGRVFRQMKAQ